MIRQKPSPPGRNPRARKTPDELVSLFLGYDSFHEAAKVVSGPLWPAKYADGSYAALRAFLAELCWTWEVTSSTCLRLPQSDYVYWAAGQWWQTRRDGQPLLIEKSRRIAMSWIMRCCELWSMGSMIGEQSVLVGLTRPKAMEHVWNLHFVYEQLRRRGKIEIPDAICYGSVAKAELEAVTLPNGSMLTHMNQEADSFQGSGYARVTMEELSRYRSPGTMYSQARFVTEPPAGEVHGHVVGITNANHRKVWRQLKDDIDASEPYHDWP